MKNIFRAIRGKKEDKEGKNIPKPSEDRGQSQLTAAAQNQPSGALPAQDKPVSRLSIPSGSITLPQTANPIPPSLGQLSALLASPASSLTADDPRHHIQLQPPPLCPLCCNFDPRHVPKTPDGPWAKAEYKIPAELPIGAEIPAGKIKIQKSQDLLESAKRGCLYCGIVQCALRAVDPGWETEDSFIHIFLALGLPVVVRLQRGVTYNSDLGAEDAALQLGVVLGKGEKMTLDVEIDDPSKPAIDVEIYRPRLTPDPATVGDIVVSRLVNHIGIAEEIPQYAGDQKCFDFISHQVANCIEKHKCGGDGHLPLLPDRVVWIEANNSSRIQLLEPKGIRAKYIALSYCWGTGPISSDTYLTDASTFSAKKAGMEYNDLPPLFRDVVNCARKLGIQYIWIDRLCIIQEDNEDFKIQAPKMGDIYGNATLTIAAASATSENDRILIEREPKWHAADLKLNIEGIGSLKLRARRRTHPLGEEAKGGDYGKVSTRAWIWQERLLSGRTVFYTPSALKFECHCHSVWEGFGPRITGISWSAKLENISHLSWLTLVEEYMRRDITRPSDRLPAMESVMKRIEKSKGWSPLCGLWSNAFRESLGWNSLEAGGAFSGKLACRMNPEHYAPTWSWASVNGPISYVSVRVMSSWDGNDPMIYDMEVRNINAALGMVTIAGRIGRVQLNCSVELNGMYGFEPDEPRYNYHYGVKYSTSGELFPIKPDVALKPWSGNVNGQNLSTVIRVPYGEVPPEQSWSASCLCLLVGYKSLRSLVLFMGGSLRESGAWERLGMASGLEPAIFAGAEKGIIDIV